MTIRISHEDFDPAALMAELRQPGSDGGFKNAFPGAVAAFTGLVRDMAGDSRITAMTLEHYPGMTESELMRIHTEAMRRWPLIRAVIIHRVGRLLAGEQIVFVGCASPHREAALEAVHFMMDFLKTDAPFWKAEERDGTTHWVEAQESDRHARGRWARQRPD